MLWIFEEKKIAGNSKITCRCGRAIIRYARVTPTPPPKKNVLYRDIREIKITIAIIKQGSTVRVQYANKKLHLPSFTTHAYINFY